MAIGLLALAGAGLAGAGLGAAKLSEWSEQNKWQSSDQMQDPSAYAPSKQSALQELLRRHNAGELDLPDEQIRQLSEMAANTGMKFVAEQKPISKFMFDFADTALFGLLPNEWRPHSIGQELHGEGFADRTASTIGSLGGSFAGGGLILKGGKMALGGLKGWMGKGSAAQGAARSNAHANFYQNPNPGLLGMPNIATGFQRYNPFRTQTQYTQGLYPTGGAVVTRGPSNSFTMI